ncbi:MAG: 3-oxoacid CoA-transferase subunit A [Trueperaceae bacterium]|nr:3-oxoacid CoA-transferase subunit A [Trueperaceae bacterium]
MRVADAAGAPALAATLAAEVAPGATVMIAGFGEPGTPFFLVDALATHGGGDLTVVKNDANEPGVGVGRLLEAGRMRRLIATHVGLNRDLMAAWEAGDLDVEIHPQGLLAERIRCGGAGLPAFLADLDPDLLPPTDPPREVVTWRGATYTVEPALRADVALIHAAEADRFGNLRYHGTARNFAPAMALAATRTWVSVDRIVDAPLDPDAVVTPGAAVDAVLEVPAGYDPGTKAARLRRGAGRA